MQNDLVNLRAIKTIEKGQEMLAFLKIITKL